jgi:ADP-ribose pyrophosphatase
MRHIEASNTRQGYPRRMKWLVTRSDQVHRDEWISIRADTCRMPDGREVGPFYVFQYPHWVNVLAVTDDQRVVLIRQYRHGLGEVVLELPGGSIEPSDEDPMDAARRELTEETCFAGGAFVKTGVLSPNPASHNNLVHCYLATDCRQVAPQALDSSEDIEVVLVPVAELRNVARTSLLQAMHVASVFLALEHLERCG